MRPLGCSANAVADKRVIAYRPNIGLTMLASKVSGFRHHGFMTPHHRLSLSQPWKHHWCGQMGKRAVMLDTERESPHMPQPRWLQHVN